MTSVVPVALPDKPAERLTALFDAHHERLYRLARRLTSGADAARDLVQETFLKAARAPRAIPTGQADEEAWLVRVLVNIRRDEWRKKEVRTRHAHELGAPSQIDAHQESALIARATVWRALDCVSPRRRAVIVMHELEGLAIPSIAASLGITAVTARWHLAMGRRDLARILRAPMGDTDEQRERSFARRGSAAS